MPPQKIGLLVTIRLDQDLVRIWDSLSTNVTYFPSYPRTASQNEQDDRGFYACSSVQLKPELVSCKSSPKKRMFVQIRSHRYCDDTTCTNVM